jgi:hypothetical protein
VPGEPATAADPCSPFPRYGIGTEARRARFHARRLDSGLWGDSRLRYNRLVSSDRSMLGDAIGRAGWRTGSFNPADDHPWTPLPTFSTPPTTQALGPAR